MARAECLRDGDGEVGRTPAPENGDRTARQILVEVAKTALPNGSCRHAISGGSFARSLRQTTEAGIAA